MPAGQPRRPGELRRWASGRLQEGGGGGSSRQGRAPVLGILQMAQGTGQPTRPPLDRPQLGCSGPHSSPPALQPLDTPHTQQSLTWLGSQEALPGWPHLGHSRHLHTGGAAQMGPLGTAALGSLKGQAQGLWAPCPSPLGSATSIPWPAGRKANTCLPGVGQGDLSSGEVSPPALRAASPGHLALPRNSGS